MGEYCGVGTAVQKGRSQSDGQCDDAPDGQRQGPWLGDGQGTGVQPPPARSGDTVMIKFEMVRPGSSAVWTIAEGRSAAGVDRSLTGRDILPTDRLVPSGPVSGDAVG